MTAAQVVQLETAAIKYKFNIHDAIYYYNNWMLMLDQHGVNPNEYVCTCLTIYKYTKQDKNLVAQYAKKLYQTYNYPSLWPILRFIELNNIELEEDNMIYPLVKMRNEVTDILGF